MEKGLTENTELDNTILFVLGGCVIVTNGLLAFIESDVFKIVNFIVVFATLFTFAWFKLILLDEYVHSFWLKKRMKKGFEYIYGYGVDEYFVLARLIFLTGVLVLAFIVWNSVGAAFGVFFSWSWVVQGCISCTLVFIYCIQLSKYDSAFGFKEVIVPFISSCIGLLLTSMFGTQLFFFFLFFAFSFIVCSKEIRSITKTLKWGDHVIVRVGKKILDSKEQQFYLIFILSLMLRFGVRKIRI